MPVTRVELEVIDNGLSFVLDDAVKGKLDNADYPLALAFTDVTDYVYGVSLRRGRNRDFERFSSGSCSIELRNQDRVFDPLNALSPFYGNIIPRRRVRVFTDDVQQYEGYIESWDFGYDVSGESVATIQANDAFTLLATRELEGVVVSEQLTGARVNAILNSVGWAASDRVVETGSSVVAAGTATGGALSYLQQVEASEQGYMFVGKTGQLFFKQRNSMLSDYVPVTFADDGSGVAYSSVNVNYGTDLLFNQAFVTYSGGTAVANSRSVSEFEVRSNKILNPSFEVSNSTWFGFESATPNVLTVARVAGGYVGSWAGQIVAPSSSDAIGVTANYDVPVTLGDVYTLSAYVKPTIGMNITTQLLFIGGITPYSVDTTVFCAAGVWTRVSVTGQTISADITAVRAQIRTPDLLPLNDGFTFDAVLLEPTNTLKDYFDGSTTDTPVWSYDWAGTVGLSESTGTRLVAQSSNSQQLYGVISHTVDTLLASAATAQDFAEYFVATHEEPEYRFSDIEVVLDRSATDTATLVALEIGDLVQIRFTPNGVGEQIDRLAEVTKIEHNIRPDSHRMIIGVSSLEFIGFILDDVEFGILDKGLLAF